LDLKQFFKLTIIYAGFAFVANLIREVVKDLEDMEGDRKFGAKTMAIEWGVPVSKTFAGVWMVVLMMSLLVVSIYAWLVGLFFFTGYMLLTVIAPLVYALFLLKKATTPKDYHRISGWIKWIILAGIFSMYLLNL
jgi:4-hydroxybenzoate polyprenyltransferase